MKKIYFCLVSIFIGLHCNHLMAEELPIEINWRGDVSTSTQYLAHPWAYGGFIGSGIQDAILHTEVKNSKSSPLKATLGFGVLEQFNYGTTLAPFSPIDIGIHYGWIDYQPSPQWQWQMGQLQSRAGVEQGVSTKNAHIQFGAINYSRSYYFPAYDQFSP